MLDGLLSRISGDDGSQTVTDGGTTAAGGGGGAPAGARVASRYEPAADEALAGLPAPHLADPTGTDERAIAEAATAAREAGVDAGTFVGSNGGAAAGLVAAAFDDLRERLDGDAAADLDAVEADLQSSLSAVFDNAGRGAAAYEDVADDPETASAGLDARFEYEAILDRAGIPMFAADASGDPVVWNHALENLTGVDHAEARSVEMLSQAFYHDGRRAKTLADKVLDAPETADEAYGVDRITDVSFTLYSDTSTMTDADGTERHIDFRAAPLYDDDGALAGVVEMIHDRSDDARRHEATGAFVESLVGTMGALREGDLGARAEFEGDPASVDESVLSVIEPFNDLAARFEEITEQVDRETSALAGAIDEAATAAGRIDRQVTDQRSMLGDAAEEIQGVSATMEEIAASSDQVAGAAEGALDAAEQGLTASQDVSAVTDDLSSRSDELVGTVEELDTLMADIEEIVGVISEVAEQTNMLALNANIEAARAGEAGAGFGVVAEEVKSLAAETSAHTDEISANIAAVKDQTEETVGAVERSHEQIAVAEDRVSVALSALDEIVEGVEEATAGISEVADANDEQADTIQGITTSIERVRDHATEAEDAVGDIVTATEDQARLVSELSASVDELSGR